MKLRKCLKHQINSDYVGIAFLGEEKEQYEKIYKDIEKQIENSK